MSNAASIALILLIVEALVLSIVPLVILAGLIYGLHRLRRFLVQAVPSVRAVSGQVRAQSHLIADRIAEPLIRAHLAPAGARAAFMAAAVRAGRLVEPWLGRR